MRNDSLAYLEVVGMMKSWLMIMPYMNWFDKAYVLYSSSVSLVKLFYTIVSQVVYGVCIMENEYYYVFMFKSCVFTY